MSEQFYDIPGGIIQETGTHIYDVPGGVVVETVAAVTPLTLPTPYYYTHLLAGVN